jgi:hypothetical protein
MVPMSSDSEEGSMEQGTKDVKMAFTVMFTLVAIALLLTLVG